MSKIIFSLTLLFSVNAFAISDANLVDACFETGIRKLELRLQSYGCFVDDQAVEVNEIDNRWLNPSKYIWYSFAGECERELPENAQTTALVQYSSFSGECF